MKKNFNSLINKEGVAGYVFISPFIIGFIAFYFIPILISLVLSFTSYDILSPPKFIGFDNFVRMFTKDATFWLSMRVTFFYAFISVPLKLAMALFVAMLFFKGTKLVSVYRGVYYLPSIMGGSVAIAIIWRRLFATDGALNGILATLGLPSSTSWLGEPSTAIWTLIVLSVWQFGSSMLIFLAGLKQVPITLYEAATVDGSSKVRQFFSITLPMITPVIFFNLIQQMINAFIAFTQSFIVTAGKPLDTTLFYTVYMYRRSFEFYEMGYGSAMAWLMLVIVSVFTAVIFVSSTKWVYREYEGGAS